MEGNELIAFADKLPSGAKGQWPVIVRNELGSNFAVFRERLIAAVENSDGAGTAEPWKRSLRASRSLSPKAQNALRGYAFDTEGDYLANTDPGFEPQAQPRGSGSQGYPTYERFEPGIRMCTANDHEEGIL